MIKSIKIDNFKSLVGFECELSKFSCLIGLNGAGKSTILQALDFLSQLMAGNMEDWLELRHWDKSDLNSKLTRTSNISFEVVIDSLWGEITWRGSFNRSSLKCTQELVKLELVGETTEASYHSRDLSLFKVDDAQCSIGQVTKDHDFSELDSKGFQKSLKPDSFPVIFKYSGSVISGLIDNQLSPPLFALKKQLLQLKSLDLLAPDALRQRSRSSEKDLGLGGEKLSAFLSELNKEQQLQLISKLKSIYPTFEQFRILHSKSGWKQLLINEAFNEHQLTTEARHVNDGMLRLMAILAQTQTDHSFLLFDEIENGINPELVEQLVHWLQDAPQQILVTTHSPMILNYLEDQAATEGVLLVYKTPEGYTRTKHFFEIPAMAEKLSVLGPGEVFIDTDLVALVKEINCAAARLQ